MQDLKVRLSTLWVFMLLNYLYCDVLGLFDPGMPKNMTQDALLAASFLMELPIAMVLLSRALKYRPNRWANVEQPRRRCPVGPAVRRHDPVGPPGRPRLVPRIPPGRYDTHPVEGTRCLCTPAPGADKDRPRRPFPRSLHPTRESHA